MLADAIGPSRFLAKFRIDGLRKLSVMGLGVDARADFSNQVFVRSRRSWDGVSDKAIVTASVESQMRRRSWLVNGPARVEEINSRGMKE